MHANRIEITCLVGIVAACFPYAGNAAFSATRHLPPSYQPNVPLSVTLNIHFEADNCGAAVEDYVPLGWTVSKIWGPGAGIWNTNSGRVVWAPIDGPLCGGPADTTLGYDLTPLPDATGSPSITGVISVDGSNVPTGGNSILYPRPLVLGFTRSDTESMFAFISCSNVLYSVQRSPASCPRSGAASGQIFKEAAKSCKLLMQSLEVRQTCFIESCCRLRRRPAYARCAIQRTVQLP